MSTEVIADGYHLSARAVAVRLPDEGAEPPVPGDRLAARGRLPAGKVPVGSCVDGPWVLSDGRWCSNPRRKRSRQFRSWDGPDGPGHDSCDKGNRCTRSSEWRV